MSSNSNYGYVYKITNLINNKCYIGQKHSDHFVSTYWGSGIYIKKALIKYGKENFNREILCWCETKEILDDKELYYIENYNSLYPNGYNLTLNVFKSGRKQKHSEYTKNKIHNTKLNFTPEHKKEIINKMKKTCQNRTQEEKEIIHNNIQKGLKNSKKFQTTIHSKEYREKQRQKSLENMKNKEILEKISKKSKECWENIEYRNKCIINLKHDDSEIQRLRSLKGNLFNTNTFSNYNKSEKAKNISRLNAEKMRKRKANMTEKEKHIMQLKIKLKALIKKNSFNSNLFNELLAEIKSFENTYDPYDSPKDRFLNKKYPNIHIVSKDILKLKKPISVYDLTVDGEIPNFQLASQIYAHNCPGGGKSRCMAFLAKQAMAAGKKVIFITVELTETETMTNINSAITGFSMHDMINKENREEFSKKRNAFINTFGGELIVKFFRPGTVNTDTLHNFIRKIMNEKKEKLNGIDWKPDFIIVDYMDKLLPIQKMQANSYADMGAVANDLKNLAISFDCPVVTGSQLGKYSWNLKDGDVISQDSVAESAQKIHIAHSMTTINANPGEKLTGRARLFLAKSRSGIANSIIWVENNLAKCTIREIEPWNPTTVNAEAGYSVKSASSGK